MKPWELTDGRRVDPDAPIEELQDLRDDARFQRDEWDADLAALEELIATRQRLALAEGGGE